MTRKPAIKTPMPVPLSDATVAFPANALEFMPNWNDIPEEFQTGRSPWCRLQEVWFALGLSQRFSFQPVEFNGKPLDAEMIFRQLRAIQGTFACKHEHKVAAVGYLASLWMASVVFGAPDTPDDKLTALGEASLDEWLAYFAEVDGLTTSKTEDEA